MVKFSNTRHGTMEKKKGIGINEQERRTYYYEGT